jgi:hypothetical protein
MYARTIVLELVKREDEAAKREDQSAAHAAAAGNCGSDVEDRTSDSRNVRIFGRTLICQGSPFDWWVMGERPALVTVSSAAFGKLNAFTDSEPEAFAMDLARQLLEQHAEQRDPSGADTGVGAERASAADGGEAGADTVANTAAEAAAAPIAPSALKMPGWFEK